jgi:hypothetical protein
LPTAGLVHVLDGGGIAYRGDEILQAGGAIAADPREGRGGDPHAEHIACSTIRAQSAQVPGTGTDRRNARAVRLHDLDCHRGCSLRYRRTDRE